MGKHIKYILIVEVLIGLAIFLFSCDSASIQYKSDSKLLSAIELDNSQACVEALRDGANVNHLTKGVRERIDNGIEESNPLRIAMYLGSNNAVDVLLENGADPNAMDQNGEPILFYAIKSLDIDLVEKLLDYGADINKTTKNGTTVIDSCLVRNNYCMYSADTPERKIEEMYDFLVSKGVSPSTSNLKNAMKGVDGSGYTYYNLIKKITLDVKENEEKSGLDPILEKIILDDLSVTDDLKKADKKDTKYLFYACALSRVSIFESVLSKGYDIDSEDDIGSCLLTISAKCGNTEVFKYLLSHFDLDNVGYDALYRAALGGYTEIIEILIENNVPFETKGMYEYTLLQAACASKNLAAFKAFYGTRVFESQYTSALMTAVNEDFTAIIDFCTSQALDLDVIDKDLNCTALQYAVIKEKTEIVKLLVKYGCDINKSTETFGTPFALACATGDKELVTYLLNNGADVDADLSANSDVSKAPIYSAVLYGNLEIVEILLDNDAYVNKEIINIARISLSEDIYKLLLNSTN